MCRIAPREPESSQRRKCMTAPTVRNLTTHLILKRTDSGASTSSRVLYRLSLFPGAMENWGLVTYRETALLVDPESSSAHTKQWVALVVGHELAHQWFGNLVTMVSAAAEYKHQCLGNSKTRGTSCEHHRTIQRTTRDWSGCSTVAQLSRDMFRSGMVDAPVAERRLRVVDRVSVRGLLLPGVRHLDPVRVV